ncbi:hypothetical protein ACIP4Y_38200 [Streptomyces sp. NPDC088810]|uniref:hypothetical protein n=1 Tax=unclassified Streptomyces TaxID=2593676 RepID=UPI00380959B3
MPDERIHEVDPARLQLSRTVSQAVKQATAILQQEVNDGSGRATTMQAKYAATKKVDPNEFKALSSRVRKDVHDLIAMAADLFSELQTDEVQTVVSRMATDAHDVLETTMNLVDNRPATAMTLANLGFTTPPPTTPTEAAADAPEPGPGPASGDAPRQPGA